MQNEYFTEEELRKLFFSCPDGTKLRYTGHRQLKGVIQSEKGFKHPSYIKDVKMMAWEGDIIIFKTMRSTKVGQILDTDGPLVMVLETF